METCTSLFSALWHCAQMKAMPMKCSGAGAQLPHGAGRRDGGDRRYQLQRPAGGGHAGGAEGGFRQPVAVRAGAALPRLLPGQGRLVSKKVRRIKARRIKFECTPHAHYSGCRNNRYRQDHLPLVLAVDALRCRSDNNPDDGCCYICRWYSLSLPGHLW